MKIKNIFKKEKTTPVANIQKMDKKQLEKVIGGADTNTTGTTTTKPTVQSYDPLVLD